MLYLLFKDFEKKDENYNCGYVVNIDYRHYLVVHGLFDNEEYYVSFNECIGIEAERIAKINGVIGEEWKLVVSDKDLSLPQRVKIIDMSISYESFDAVFLHMTFENLVTAERFTKAYAI